MIIAMGWLLIWTSMWTALDILCGAFHDGEWWFRSSRRTFLGFVTWLVLVYIWLS